MDVGSLKAVAKMTGGLCRLAEDAEALRSVYREIDQLEKSEIESIRYLDYRERFVLPAALALAVLAFEVLLSCTLLRRVP